MIDDDDDDGPHTQVPPAKGSAIPRDARDSTLPGVIALTLTAPLAYEANPGIIQGVAPPGTTRLRVLADGRSVRVLRLTSGRRAFLLGPIGLPPRDLTLKVEALAGSRVLASATVEHVFGLPAAAAAVAPPQHDRRRRAARRRGPAGTHGGGLGRLGARPRERSHRGLQRRCALPGREHGQARDPARRARARLGRPAALVLLVARARARARLLQPRRQRAASARRRRGRRRHAVARARRDRHVHVLRLPARARRATARDRAGAFAGRCRRRRSSTSPPSRAASTRRRTISARCSSR